VEQRLLQGLQWVEVLLHIKQTQEEEDQQQVERNNLLHIKHVSQAQGLLLVLCNNLILSLLVHSRLMNTKLEYNHQLLIRQGNRNKQLPEDKPLKPIKRLQDNLRQDLQQGQHQFHNNRIRSSRTIRILIRFNKRINL
tara:strand:+ start:71 stop:484 length:414 start_codon:yes stop_codon:yes gene_type:complete